MSQEIDLDDLEILKIRCPSLEDKLFAGAEDYWMNARLDWYPDPTELYVIGYKEAGDILVKDVAERRGRADTLIFPIVFLYRHYIELRLKSLLKDGCRLLNREHEQKPVHRLSKLWKEVRSILVELWLNHDEDELKAMDMLIAQFEAIDPKSTSFRYSKDLNGNNSLQSLQIKSPRVNIRNLADVVDGMSTILDGSSDAISEYQRYKNDMANISLF